jgi:hypothetical protein
VQDLRYNKCTLLQNQAYRIEDKKYIDSYVSAGKSPMENLSDFALFNADTLMFSTGGICIRQTIVDVTLRFLDHATEGCSNEM